MTAAAGDRIEAAGSMSGRLGDDGVIGLMTKVLSVSDKPDNLIEEPVVADRVEETAQATGAVPAEDATAKPASADEAGTQEDVAPEALADVPNEPSAQEQEEVTAEAAAEAESPPAGDETDNASEAGVAASAAPESEPAAAMDWYILKVQSNREKSISEALRRRVSMEGLDEYFDEIIVPTEKVTEFKGGKKRVVRRKLYPGYILVHMHINDDTWFVVRETPGIGDFTGSGGKPTPMLAHEVKRIVSKQEEKTDEAPKLKINFKVGDRVKINEGTFGNFEGEVSSIDEASGHVIVMINIFGRSTPVELEYWQIETL